MKNQDKERREIAARIMAQLTTHPLPNADSHPGGPLALAATTSVRAADALIKELNNEKEKKSS